MWPTVVGEQLSEVSVPISLDGKTLSVGVPGREWKREFEQHAGNMIYKLNAALKNSIVDRLEFVIDTEAIRTSRKQRGRDEDRTLTVGILEDITVAASTIADLELRTNFLKAAAACIGRRNTAAR
jgi:hypothetical protein